MALDLSTLSEWIQLCIDQSPDNVLQAYTGAEGDVDAAGNPVPPGAPALIKATDPFFGPGEVLPEGAPEVELPDGTVISGGDPVPDGFQGYITYNGGDEIYCNAKGGGELLLLDCKNEPLDGPQQPLTQGQGHAPTIASTVDLTGCGVSPDCAPEILECMIDGMITSTQNQYGSIMWEARGGEWVPIMVSPRTWNAREGGASDTITASMLLGAEATPTMGTTLANAWNPVNERCVEIVNDDCVPWRVDWDWRWAFSGSQQSGSNWQARVVGGGDLESGNFSGTAFLRADARCYVPDCQSTFGNLASSEAHVETIVNPGETFTGCVILELRINNTVDNASNEIGGQVLSLDATITRSICNP